MKAGTSSAAGALTKSAPGLPDGEICEPKNTKFGTFWRALEWKMLLYFMVVWYIYGCYGIFGIF
jgi:hypothetical protein